jgi:hypothetical protein
MRPPPGVTVLQNFFDILAAGILQPLDSRRQLFENHAHRIALSVRGD